MEQLNAPRRQIILHPETEATGPAHRGRLRGARSPEEGSGAARLGHGERGDRWRQEERIRPGPESEPRAGAERREEGRAGLRPASQGRALGLRTQGGRHSQASGGPRRTGTVAVAVADYRGEKSLQGRPVERRGGPTHIREAPRFTAAHPAFPIVGRRLGPVPGHPRKTGERLANFPGEILCGT
jgi:hypothetical protein